MSKESNYNPPSMLIIFFLSIYLQAPERILFLQAEEWFVLFSIVIRKITKVMNDCTDHFKKVFSSWPHFLKLDIKIHFW